jgi:hypothetical protein
MCAGAAAPRALIFSLAPLAAAATWPPRNCFNSFSAPLVTLSALNIYELSALICVYWVVTAESVRAFDCCGRESVTESLNL